MLQKSPVSYGLKEARQFKITLQFVIYDTVAVTDLTYTVYTSDPVVNLTYTCDLYFRFC
jgi:hypothetical protein